MKYLTVMYKKVITIFFCLLMLFNVQAFAQDDNDEIQIFDLSNDSVSDVSITRENTYVRVKFNSGEEVDEYTKHFIVLFNDGMFMVDNYPPYEGNEHNNIRISYFKNVDDFPVTVLSGELGTTFNLSVMLLHKVFPDIKIIELQGIDGGADSDNILLGMHYIYDNKYSTYVGKNHKIVSAGLDVFLSGYRRYSEKGAVLRTHNFGGQNGEELDSDNEVFENYSKAYKKFGVSDEFMKLFISKSTSVFFNLTPKQITDLNVNNTTLEDIFTNSGLPK